jgi:hypothetical protein
MLFVILYETYETQIMLSGYRTMTRSNQKYKDQLGKRKHTPMEHILQNEDSYNLR